MIDLDTLLSIIENPTRRKILEALVREPHYPLQLSRELRMSQQAIMKHLKVLEENNIVRSYIVDSDRGGPARRIYVPVQGFTIFVDVGPGLFNVEIFSRENFNKKQGADFNVSRNEEVDFNKFCKKYSNTKKEISEIDKELDDLQRRRKELIEKKEALLNEAKEFIESFIGDYEARRVIYESIKRPMLSPSEIARELDLRDEVVEEILNEIDRGDRNVG